MDKTYYKCKTCGKKYSPQTKVTKQIIFCPCCSKESWYTEKTFFTQRREYLDSLIPDNSLDIALKEAQIFKRRNSYTRRPNNTGECILASDEFERVLFKKRIKASVQFGFYKEKEGSYAQHAWNEVWCPKHKEYFIVDLTADQFGEKIPDIVFGKRNELIGNLYEYED